MLNIINILICLSNPIIYLVFIIKTKYIEMLEDQHKNKPGFFNRWIREIYLKVLFQKIGITNNGKTGGIIIGQ